MSTKIRLGIALYNSRWNLEGARHMALVVNSLQNTLSGRVSIFQAVNRQDNVWKTHHLEGRLVSDAYYYGIVDLGVIRGSEDIVLDILERFSAEAEGYDTHGHTWSCAWWVIRALRGIQATYPFALPEDDLELYTNISTTMADHMPLAPGPLHAVKLRYEN